MTTPPKKYTAAGEKIPGDELVKLANDPGARDRVVALSALGTYEYTGADLANRSISELRQIESFRRPILNSDYRRWLITELREFGDLVPE